MSDLHPGDTVMVTWADPLPPLDEIGVVLEPTADDLAYFQAQEYPPERSVLVRWNGLDWDTAWYRPDELRVVEP